MMYKFSPYMIFGPDNFVLLDLDKADASWRWSWFVWDSLSSSELLPGNYPYLTTLYKAAGFYVCLWTSAVWINLTRVGLLAWEHHRYTRRWWNIIIQDWTFSSVDWMIYYNEIFYTTHNGNSIFIGSGFKSSKNAASAFFSSAKLIGFWQ